MSLILAVRRKHEGERKTFLGHINESHCQFEIGKYPPRPNFSLFRDSIGIMFIVFANSPGDRGSIPGRLITKAQKMVFDA